MRALNRLMDCVVGAALIGYLAWAVWQGHIAASLSFG